MKKLLALIVSSISILAHADDIIKPGATDPSTARYMFLKDATGSTVPAVVVYTSDGNGNIIPLSSSGLATSVSQGNAGSPGQAWYVQAASLPLPTNAAQETGGHLASIDSKTLTAGQKTMAASYPVVISSDQSPIAITGNITASNASVGVTGAAVPTSTNLIGGRDGSGNLASVTVTSGAMKVDGSATTQPVSAASLPLPANAAQETGGHLASTDAKIIQGQQTMANSISVVLASNQTTVPISGTVTTSNPVVTMNGHPAPIFSGEVGAIDPSGNLNGIHINSSGTLLVDGSAITQPISAVALPLPSNASKETGGNLATVVSNGTTVIANQTNGTQQTKVVDASGNVQPAGDVNGHGIHVYPGDGTNQQSYSILGEAKVLVTPLTSSSTVTAVQGTGSNLHTQVDSGTLTANIGTTNGLALDASVISVQGTINASAPAKAALSGGKDGSGNIQALSVSSSGQLKIEGGNSTSVKIDGSSVIQPVSGTVAVSNFPVTQPVSGTVTANAGTGTFTVGQSTGANLHADIDNFPATQPVSGSVSVSNFPVTQPVSGTVTANIGTTGGLALDSSLTTINTTLGSPFQAGGSIGNTSFGATQSGNWSFRAQDGSGNLLTSQVNGSQRALDVGVNVAGVQVDPRSIRLLTSSDTTTVVQPTGSNLHTTVDSLPSIPAGANAIGSVTVSNFPGTQPISGTVTANAGTGTFTVGQSTGTNLHTNVDNFPATQPVSGTITANIGTTNGLALDATVANVQGSSTGGTAGTKSSLSGAIFNTSAPTLTNGQQASLQANSSGSLKVDGSAVTQPVSGSVTVSNFPVTQPVSGTVTSNAGTGTFTVGQATGTNLHTVVDSGTVTSNIGTTNGLALDATVSGLQVSQGSTTSGQKGGLGLGAVTTAAPTYTTAQSSPMSLTTAGALRTDASATTQPVSGSVSVSNFPATQPVSGTVTANAGTGNFTVVQGTGTNLHTVVDSGTITANVGTTNGLALDATVSNVQGTVAAGTAATKSSLIGTQFNTSLPTLTNGQQSAAQADSSGRLLIGSIASALPSGGNTIGSVNAIESGTWNVRVQDTAGTGINSQAIGGTQYLQTVEPYTATAGSAVPSRSTLIAGQDGSGNARNISTDASGVVNVSVSSTATEKDASTTGTLNAACSSGVSCGAGSTVALTVSGISSSVLNLSGTFVGTIVIDCTTDSFTTFKSLSIANKTGGSLSSSVSSGGYYEAVSPESCSQVRARMSAFTSGSATVQLNASAGNGYMQVASLSAAQFLGTMNLNDGSGTALTSASGVLNTNTKTPTTANAPANVSVGASSGSLVASNSSRKGLVVMNLSVNTVSLGLAGASAVLNSGITLYPGGVWYMDEFTFSTGAVNAIAGAGSSSVSVQEFQ